jgi:hypothetical protein
MLLGAGLSLIGSSPISAASADSSPVPAATPATLHVLLTTAPQLPAASRASMIAETTSVWRKAGVRLLWLAGSDSRLVSGALLRVLVVPRPASGADADNAPILGELLSLGKPRALALASISRAQQQVAAWRGYAMLPPFSREDLLGLVLGRTVAHEIGHYLLNTRTHAPEGLMRATFETSELVDRRSRTFYLDVDATTWLQDRVNRGMTLGPAAGPHREERVPTADSEDTGFSYRVSATR